MKTHICEEWRFCTCSQLALEPDEHCPVHGGCFVKPVCIHCGRFMPYKKRFYPSLASTERASGFCPERVGEG